MNSAIRLLSVALPLALLAGCEDKPQPPATTSAAPAATTAAPAATTAAPTTASAASTPSVTFNKIEPGAFDIDVSHSRLGFGIKHMLVSNTRGEFRKFTGTAQIDTENLDKSSVTLDIDADSIETRDEKRDKHLKSKDFFETDKFKKLTFKSTKITKTATGYDVTGDLTIRDQTKSVTIAFEPFAAEAKDPWGNQRTGTRGTAKIKRSDFGITWNDPGKVVLAEEVSLEIDVEFIRKKDAAAAGSASAAPSASAKK
jgi:polyisoprenoid-binding protein YceI